MGKWKEQLARKLAENIELNRKVLHFQRSYRQVEKMVTGIGKKKKK